MDASDTQAMNSDEEELNVELIGIVEVGVTALKVRVETEVALTMVPFGWPTMEVAVALTMGPPGLTIDELVEALIENASVLLRLKTGLKAAPLTRKGRAAAERRHRGMDKDDNI